MVDTSRSCSDSKQRANSIISAPSTPSFPLSRLRSLDDDDDMHHQHGVGVVPSHESLSYARTWMVNDDIVKLNVGGHKYHVSRRTLLTIPHSFFSGLLSAPFAVSALRCDDGAFFIDRCGQRFRHILNWMRSGRVYIELLPEWNNSAINKNYTDNHTNDTTSTPLSSSPSSVPSTAASESPRMVVSFWRRIAEEARFYALAPLIATADDELLEAEMDLRQWQLHYQHDHHDSDHNTYSNSNITNGMMDHHNSYVTSSTPSSPLSSSSMSSSSPSSPLRYSPISHHGSTSPTNSDTTNNNDTIVSSPSPVFTLDEEF